MSVLWEYCDFLVTEVFGQARIEDESSVEQADEADALTIQGEQRSAVAQAGDDGWELVSVVPLMIAGTTCAERYIFKRPRR